MEEKGNVEIDTDALHSRLRDGTTTGKSQSEECQKTKEAGSRTESACRVEFGVKGGGAVGTVDE